LALKLAIRDVDAGYGAVRALHGVSLEIAQGQTVALLGTNGNGKSTLMKCIMGIVRPARGSVMLEMDGTPHDLTRLSTEDIVNLGVAMVPEGRRLFPKLTVEENLLLGAYRRQARAAIQRNRDFCLEAFPVLAERRRQYGLTVLMAEQNFHQAIRIADRGYIIVHGEIVFQGNVADLEQNELVKNYYLGTTA